MKVPNTPKNMKLCICPKCPSFSQCMRDKDNYGFYCATEKTSCEPAKDGCICGECPVTADYDLTEFYYCINGKAK